MKFIAAGEIIGDLHKVLTVKITQHPNLPDGEYSFIDMYCSDRSCDCRKTMIHVTLDGVFVSLINYGWQDEKFYRKWMGVNDLYPLDPLWGASIDFASPDRVSREGMLELFHVLLSEEWKSTLMNHYKLFKKKLKTRKKQSRFYRNKK